jgi:hypothetical protein
LKHWSCVTQHDAGLCFVHDATSPTKTTQQRRLTSFSLLQEYGSTVRLREAIRLHANPTPAEVCYFRSMGYLARSCALSVLCLAACGKVIDNVDVTVTTVGPGTVMSDPAVLTDLPRGTSVTLTAVGELIAWGGGCSGSSACTLTADEDVTVTASFENAETLTVAASGAGTGTTTSTPAGIDCGATCMSDFPMGAVVTLTQTTTDPDTRIGGWVDPSCSKNQPCVVPLDAAKTLTSYFDKMLIDTSPTPTDITDVRTDGAISLQISASAATVITELDTALVVMSSDTRVRFAIFDQTSLALLYVSDPVSAPLQNPPASAFVHSPPMSFTMSSGTLYQFAAMVEGTAAFPWDLTAEMTGGLITHIANANPTSFLNPTLPAGTAGVDPRFQIWGHAL